MPVAKSMYWLPSTSVRLAPFPAAAKTGIVDAIPRGRYRSRSAWSSRDRGPGQSAIPRIISTRPMALDEAHRSRHACFAAGPGDVRADRGGISPIRRGQACRLAHPRSTARSPLSRNSNAAHSSSLIPLLSPFRARRPPTVSPRLSVRWRSPSRWQPRLPSGSGFCPSRAEDAAVVSGVLWCAFVTYMVMVGIRVAARFQYVLLGLEYFIVLGFAILGYFHGGGSTFSLSWL